MQTTHRNGSRDQSASSSHETLNSIEQKLLAARPPFFSKPVQLTHHTMHRCFVQSKFFSKELACIPHKWRQRLVDTALEKMSWAHWWKIYESIAIDHVRDFAKQHVPAGLDLSQDDSDIVATAEKAATNVVKMLWTAESEKHALDLIDTECADYGIEVPDFEDDPTAVIARVIDARWWRRQLRKRVKRAFEAGNIKLGYVHYRGEPYASNDAVLSRISQNKRNAAALEANIVKNEFGQQFSIAELAEKTTANKSIRRSELMLRINGFEQIARENNDQGLFLTWTCPSRFHATRHDGKPNKNYDGSTPYEANQYLGKMTALCRSALARRGIGLYGFRIAEPHHDGCPHWHMLLFVRATDKYKTDHITDIASRAVRIMKRYAWRVDRGEPGAFKRRLDVKKIDWAKGSAAGYIAKYVAKNIDGVTDHKTKEGHIVAAENVGEVELVPSARVEAWAAAWGIRQFQQWGGAPVTVWRELRRIDKGMIDKAPPAMLAAWNAVQKIEGEQRACWASYLRVQGGALINRKDLVITLAKDEKTVIGRYGETQKITPYGVRCSELVGVVFKSVRYTWTPVQTGDVRASASVAVAFPWTRVNNCTDRIDRSSSMPTPCLPLPSSAPPIFSHDEATQLTHAWLALGACPWPRPVVNEAPPRPTSDMSADEQRRVMDSWDAIKACPWPRLVLKVDEAERSGTPRQIAEWQSQLASAANTIQPTKESAP